MSLAQRRTTAEGIDHGIGCDHARRNSNENDQIDDETVGAPDQQVIWRVVSYDAFKAPELEHYESFPPELTDHIAAYEVSTARRVAQVIFAIIACAFSSGIVCGFAALKPILIAEGVYRDLCPPGWSGPNDDESQPPCPEQDMRLNLFFIAASITLNVSTVFAGYVLDNHGRRVCYILAALILFFGGVIMGTAFAFPGWVPFDGYFVGNLLLGLGGTFVFVPSYQLANAFPRYAGLIVALVTGAFDASAAVYLCYRISYEATNKAFKPAYFFYGFCITVPPMIIIAEFALMPSREYDTRGELEQQINHAKDASRDVHDSDNEIINRAELQRVRNRRARDRKGELDKIETVTGDAVQRRQHRNEVALRQATSGVWGVLHDAPISRQMMTSWFMLILLLTILQMLRMNYFIATIRAQYRYMLNSETLARHINEFFDAALPVAGVVSTPFIGLLLNKVSVVVTLAVVSVLIIVLGVLNCLPFVWAAYATVLVFVIFRPLYYSATSDYATKVFGFATFGRIYGTIICVSGITNFIQPGLDALTHGPLNGNPVPINVFFAIGGSAISAALTLFVYTMGKTYRENNPSSIQEDERTGLLEEHDEYGTVAP